ncbi:MAG: hypothetical protein V3S55_15555 [Nitrospiraceae bacterium]
MTPKRKKEHIAVLKALIVADGFEQDRFGNLKKETATGLYRFKFKQVALRFEKRMVDGRWINLQSGTIVRCTGADIVAMLLRANR